MTASHELIRERIAALRLSMKGVSEEIGLNHAYIQQYLQRGIPKRLPEDVRIALAKILKVEQDDLREEGLADMDSPIVPASFPRIVPNDVQMLNGMPRNVPVTGAAACGDGGLFEFNGQTIELAPRPPRLDGVPDAYALYVCGSSMRPWREEGQLVYVHPRQPPKIGDYVVVQMKPKQEGAAPHAYIKRLMRRTERELHLEQYNPAKEFTLATAAVLTIHRIVDWPELLGI